MNEVQKEVRYWGLYWDKFGRYSPSVRSHANKAETAATIIKNISHQKKEDSK